MEPLHSIHFLFLPAIPFFLIPWMRKIYEVPPEHRDWYPQGRIRWTLEQSNRRIQSDAAGMTFRRLSGPASGPNKGGDYWSLTRRGGRPSERRGEADRH